MITLGTHKIEVVVDRWSLFRGPLCYKVRNGDRELRFDCIVNYKKLENYSKLVESEGLLFCVITDV